MKRRVCKRCHRKSSRDVCSGCRALINAALSTELQRLRGDNGSLANMIMKQMYRN